jgi:SAM-dependent methyltransferase
MPVPCASGSAGRASGVIPGSGNGRIPGPAPGSRSDNEAKYRSSNPVVRWLVGRFLAEVGRLVAERATGRVLEVGCGEGIVMRYLRDHQAGLRLDGVEPDPAALAQARLRNPDSRFVRGDAYHLGIASRAYDLVLCLEVLEHLADPGRALSEVRRVARRGCILSVPHEPFFRLGNLCRGKNLRRLGDPPDHVQHWSKRGFEAFCHQHVRPDRTVVAFPWIIVSASL